jgi:cell division septal protein FtsQ
MAMKMRQSLAQLEQEFRHETQLDRSRRETLRRHAARRSRMRTHARRRKRSSLRYWMLVLSLILTAVIVTVVMFETLYYLLG